MINLKASIVGTVLLAVSVFVLSPVRVEAMGNNIKEGSVVISEEMSEGYALHSTKGVYLQSGLSRISKAGAGKVTVTGITFAQQKVDEVTVNVELQYMDKGNWRTYKMWTKTAKDDISVEFVETLDVDPGIYKVKSIHSANGDVSSSFTDGLYIS